MAYSTLRTRAMVNLAPSRLAVRQQTMFTSSRLVAAMTTSAFRLVFTLAVELGATPRPEASALTLVSTPAWEASA